MVTTKSGLLQTVQLYLQLVMLCVLDNMESDRKPIPNHTVREWHSAKLPSSVGDRPHLLRPREAP